MRAEHKRIKNAIRFLNKIGYMACDMKHIYPSPLNRHSPRDILNDKINARAKKSGLQ